MCTVFFLLSSHLLLTGQGPCVEISFGGVILASTISGIRLRLPVLAVGAFTQRPISLTLNYPTHFSATL